MLNGRIKIAPSILSADFARLGKQIELIEKAGADLVHVDVMDGHFVPNITIGPPVVSAINKNTELPLDVHLMIQNPAKYIEDFVKAGSDWLSVHVEADPNIELVVQKIKSFNVKAGVAINPQTELKLLEPVLDKIDFAVVMSVNPGFGGQSFIPEVLEKIKALRAIIDRQKLNIDIEVDGGISSKNAVRVVEAGADVLVAGAAVFGSGEENITGAVQKLQQLVSDYK
jgi:ribulose-phosphate 3-epimerase